MESKLGLNLELVNQARQSAAHVAEDTQRFIDQHTTVTVERAVCRLLGIDGVNEMDVPLPNVVVDHMMATSFLPVGAAWAIGNAMIETGKDPQAVAEAIDKGELDLSKVPAHSDEEIRAYIATGEPMDKAGAYGIQGRGALFVIENGIGVMVGCLLHYGQTLGCMKTSIYKFTIFTHMKLLKIWMHCSPHLKYFSVYLPLNSTHVRACQSALF